MLPALEAIPRYTRAAHQIFRDCCYEFQYLGFSFSQSIVRVQRYGSQEKGGYDKDCFHGVFHYVSRLVLSRRNPFGVAAFHEFRNLEGFCFLPAFCCRSRATVKAYARRLQVQTSSRLFIAALTATAEACYRYNHRKKGFFRVCSGLLLVTFS